MISIEQRVGKSGASLPYVLAVHSSSGHWGFVEERSPLPFPIAALLSPARGFTLCPCLPRQVSMPVMENDILTSPDPALMTLSTWRWRQMWVSPGAGCSESMMPRCKWGAATTQVRGQQLGLFNQTNSSSPSLCPCENPSTYEWGSHTAGVVWCGAHVRLTLLFLYLNAMKKIHQQNMTSVGLCANSKLYKNSC